MQRRRFLTTSFAASAIGSLSSTSNAATGEREYYELRRYHLQSGPQRKLLDKYLEEALIPALNRLDVKPIGAFELYLGPETPAIYLLIPSTSVDVLANVEARLEHDEQYRKAGEPFLAAPAKEPAFLRIDSSLFVAFEGYPKLTVPPVTAQRGARVFQLRTYESPSHAAHRRKMEMFHSGEFGIFEKAGFWSVFYGDALIGQHLPNLTYMLSFPNLSELDAKWKLFFDHPDWKKLSSSSRFNYEAIVSNISNLILRPTTYSQI